ncbi:MAG: hypothetical protein R3C60_08550 [Parvularculaceae bacterium]
MRAIEEGRGLEKLLKLAKARVEEETIRIRDLEMARKNVAASIDALDSKIATEQRVAAADARIMMDLKNFLGGAAEKRLTLLSTLDGLAEEISSGEKDLASAFTEMKKLEHLVDLAHDTKKRQSAKFELEQLDEAASRMNAARR